MMLPHVYQLPGTAYPVVGRLHDCFRRTDEGDDCPVGSLSRVNVQDLDPA